MVFNIFVYGILDFFILTIKKKKKKKQYLQIGFYILNWMNTINCFHQFHLLHYLQMIDSHFRFQLLLPPLLLHH